MTLDDLGAVHERDRGHVPVARGQEEDEAGVVRLVLEDHLQAGDGVQDQSHILSESPNSVFSIRSTLCLCQHIFLGQAVHVRLSYHFSIFLELLYNRVTHLLANLGWVDFDLGCSTLCLVLHGLMGN